MNFEALHDDSNAIKKAIYRLIYFKTFQLVPQNYKKQQNNY